MFEKGLEYSGSRMSQQETLIMMFLLRYRNLNTRDLYQVRMRVFFQWCQQHELDILQLSRVHMELYLTYLLETRNQKDSTAKGSMHTVQAFYRMLDEDDVITKNPAAYVKLPPEDDNNVNRPHLNRTQFSDLLEYSKSTSPKFAAMVCLLGILGLRASELCSLTPASARGYQQGYRMLEFTGKGNKAASLPMPMLVIRELETYEATLLPDQPKLFMNDTSGLPYDRRSLLREIRRLCTRAGVPVVSPHALRRSMVTNSLNAGADIREVQKAARHADVRTTSRVYDRGTVSHDSSSFNVLAGFISGAI